MQKELLLSILAQNKMTCSFAFSKISKENAGLKLNNRAASAGFIYRHIAETINLFPTFFGIATDTENTTMGKTDEGQGINTEESRQMINKGFNILEELIQNTSDEAWMEMIDTPFFGKVSRLRLFSHILFHNSHHAGQISLTLSKAS